MGNLRTQCSLSDTSNLRELILENPGLPLLIFCGEEAWSGEWAYEQAESVSKGRVLELTLYDRMWRTRDDYEEALADDLSDAEEYKDMSEKEYDRAIKEIVARTEFVRAIVVYVG